MKKFLFYLIAACGTFTSCNNEIDGFIPQNDDIMTRATVDTLEYLNITYKDKTYQNVPTTYDENGDFVFLDEAFSAVYAAELANDMDWSISAKDSRNITFYADLKSNFKSNGVELEKMIEIAKAGYWSKFTRGGYEDLAEATLYDDKNFKDRQISFTLDEITIYTDASNLKDNTWKFNDKCSSLILTNNLPNDPNKTLPLDHIELPYSEIEAVFIGYDDRGFSDRTITCVAPPESVRKYESLPGFNDKMSSCKFMFAKRGQYYTKF